MIYEVNSYCYDNDYYVPFWRSFFPCSFSDFKEAKKFANFVACNFIDDYIYINFYDEDNLSSDLPIDFIIVRRPEDDCPFLRICKPMSELGSIL